MEFGREPKRTARESTLEKINKDIFFEKRNVNEKRLESDYKRKSTKLLEDLGSNLRVK